MNGIIRAQSNNNRQRPEPVGKSFVSSLFPGRNLTVYMGAFERGQMSRLNLKDLEPRAERIASCSQLWLERFIFLGLPRQE